jgi:cellulose synthase/poly-beta-1,6-N-acetylglucosamine synthase-like glycosyltransferase
MIFVLFLINATLLALALINFATIRHPRKVEETQESVLVLLPVRNEEENVERILTELFTQEHLAQYQVLVIDDNSEDRTYELAERYVSERVSVMRAPLPNPGWIGKVSALQAGFNSLTGEIADVVISIDADVHFEPDAIARTVATLKSSGLDFISPYPRQIANTWAERLIQPLLQWSWMSTVLLRGAEKFPMQSTVICNGQFLAMKGSSLRAIGGFESVAHKVLDDIELGRSFVAAGFRGSVIDGSEISSTRMYSSLAEIKSGYGKSLHTAFGSIFGSIFAALFIAATGIIPLLYCLDGNLLAFAALMAIIGTRFISAAASSTRLRDSLLHPLSSALFIYLLYFSWRNRGKTQWKGRTL